MLCLKNKWMIGFLLGMVSIIYIGALVTGPLEPVCKNDNMTTIEANI